MGGGRTQVSLSNLTALLQLGERTSGAARYRPPAVRVFRYSPHTVWLEDRPPVEEEEGEAEAGTAAESDGRVSPHDSGEESGEVSAQSSSPHG